MKRVLADAESFDRPKLRPSLPAATAACLRAARKQAQAGGHEINRRFADNNGGAIPWRAQKSAICRLKSEIKRSVALDIFAGSNTTGSAAEKLNRRWLAFEKDRTYLAASTFRFVGELPAEQLATLWSRLNSDDLPVEVNRRQRELVLREEPAAYATKSKRR